MKTMQEYLLEASLTDEEEAAKDGYYTEKGGKKQTVKKNGNKYYVFNLQQGRWFPIKKELVKQYSADELKTVLQAYKNDSSGTSAPTKEIFSAADTKQSHKIIDDWLLDLDSMESTLKQYKKLFSTPTKHELGDTLDIYMGLMTVKMKRLQLFIDKYNESIK